MQKQTDDCKYESCLIETEAKDGLHRALFFLSWAVIYVKLCRDLPGPFTSIQSCFYALPVFGSRKNLIYGSC